MPKQIVAPEDRTRPLWLSEGLHQTTAPEAVPLKCLRAFALGFYLSRPYLSIVVLISIFIRGF